MGDDKTEKDPLVEKAKLLREHAQIAVDLAVGLRRLAEELEKETWKCVKELERRGGKA